MDVTLYRNIDLVRIPIKAGISEYYFPKNVDWAACKVDKIIAVLPDKACNDPMDGVTPVLTKANAGDIYFNIYSAEQREIFHAVSIEQLSHLNNNAITIDSELNLKLCNLYFTSTPASDCTLLLYVYHDSECKETNLPHNSITAEFPLAAGAEINLRKIIDTYIHALPSRVKGVLFWSAATAPAYFTLRDHDLTYVLQNLHSELARPDMNGGTAADSQAEPMLFDDIDIDFDYSHIRNAESQDNVQKVTFLY